jgi:hypothetical protein
MTTSRLVIILASLATTVGCTDLESATNLNVEGPPMIRQVRLKEISTDAGGSTVIRTVFAFGTHEQATDGDYPALGPNAMTTAAATGQKIRVVIDELLIGNYLEEIACRAPVDDDAYDFVPLGTTPDDVAKCSVARDVLPSSCPGTLEHALCLCKIEGGCGDTPMGGPVGVLDVNQDGAADDTRFVPGAVGLRCGSIDVPIDLNNSYWQPSGDQNKPAMGGFDALGPAIVLTPVTNTVPPANALPTNSQCQLTFAPNIVDKQNTQVCAPAGGDVDKGCQPGDVSAFQFQTQPLVLANQSFSDGDTGVDRLAPVVIVSNAPLASGGLASVTVKQGTTNFTGFTVTQPTPQTLRINWTAMLPASTTFTITIATTLTDVYGQPLVMPVTYTFTTGA